MMGLFGNDDERRCPRCGAQLHHEQLQYKCDVCSYTEKVKPSTVIPMLKSIVRNATKTDRALRTLGNSILSGMKIIVLLVSVFLVFQASLLYKENYGQQTIEVDVALFYLMLTITIASMFLFAAEVYLGRYSK